MHLSGTPDLTRNEIWLDNVHRTTTYVPLYGSETSTLYLKVGLPLEGPVAEARANSIRNFTLVGLGSLLALMAAMFAAGQPATAVDAMLASIIATWVAAVVQLVVLNRRLARAVPPGPKRFAPRRWP